MLSLPTPTTAPLRCRCCCICCAAVAALLLCAEAVHVSIHNGVSIQICRRFLRRGQGKKSTTKPSRSFGFVFLGNRKTDFLVFVGNRKTDLKNSVFGCEKPKKTTEYTDFRFSVHNSGRAYFISYVANWRKIRPYTVLRILIPDGLLETRHPR